VYICHYRWIQIFLLIGEGGKILDGGPTLHKGCCLYLGEEALLGLGKVEKCNANFGRGVSNDNTP